MTGPEVIYRYNRFRAAKIVGQNAIGYSSGQSATAMDRWRALAHWFCV